MKTNLSIAVALLGVLLLCFTFLLGDRSEPDGSAEEIEVYCAAGLRKPIEEIAKKYESEFGVNVRLNYGGSGQLLAKISVSGGDLYIPADASYVERARSEGIVSEDLPLSFLIACLVVEKGNPKNIRLLSDLTKQDLRVVLAEESAAIGQFAHGVLEKMDLLEEIENGSISKVGTVNEVALQVKLGSSDVGVVWDSLRHQFADLEFVRVEELASQKKLASVGVIKDSRNIDQARRFARYLTENEVSALILKKYGLASNKGEGE